MIIIDIQAHKRKDNQHKEPSFHGQVGSFCLHDCHFFKTCASKRGSGGVPGGDRAARSADQFFFLSSSSFEIEFLPSKPAPLHEKLH